MRNANAKIAVKKYTYTALAKNSKSVENYGL